MGAEARIRQRHRAAIKRVWPHAVVRGRPGNAWSGEGWPDLDIIVEGVPISLEFKSSTGRATTVQIVRIASIRRAGGYAWVVHTPEQSVAAVREALTRRRMPDTFDFLFSEDDAPKEPTGEIRAFLQPPSEEPDVQAAVERNGHEPAGDGVMQVPPDDFQLAGLHNAIAGLSDTIAVLSGDVKGLADLIASLRAAAAPPQAEEAVPASPAETPKSARRRRS